MRQCKVYVHDMEAGVLQETDDRRHHGADQQKNCQKSFHIVVFFTLGFYTDGKGTHFFSIANKNSHKSYKKALRDWSRGALRLEILVLGLRIEAGTVLLHVWQVAVAEDLGVGIVHLQRLQQGVQGGFLLAGTGVGGTALGCQTTLVADTYRVLVVTYRVGTHQLLVPRLVHLSLTGDVVVVAGEPEAGIVAGDEVLDREPAVAARGTAVDDDETDCTHD